MTDQHGGPGWYPDPYHRYQYRYFNGQQWTADVSVDGRRFVDNLPLTSTYRPAYAQAAKPKKGFAVASMVIGICSVVVAWMPFMFFFGIIGLILSIVFGLIGLARARKPDGEGKGLAIAGLVLAAVSLALVPVGVVLTGKVIDQVRDLADPGPYDVAITTCEQRELSTRVEGTITNLDDRTRGYVITVALLNDQGRIIDRAEVTVDTVFAGDSDAFSANLAAEPGSCEVYDVGSTLFATG